MSDVGLILHYPATFIRRSVLQSRGDSACTLHERVIANYDRELQERGVWELYIIIIFVLFFFFMPPILRLFLLLFQELTDLHYSLGKDKEGVLWPADKMLPHGIWSVQVDVSRGFMVRKDIKRWFNFTIIELKEVIVLVNFLFLFIGILVTIFFAMFCKTNWLLLWCEITSH